MEDIVIVSAARTAVGRFGGTLAKTPAPELGAAVIKALLARTGLNADQIGEVILGQVLTAGSGQNPARQALIKSGLLIETPALTVNCVCGSGLKAVMLAAQAVAYGDSDIVIAGGQENMSASPHVLLGSRDGQRMGDWKMIDSMIVDGLWDVYNQVHMGITAENVNKKYGITREMQDALALGSQQKAAAAQDAGKFKDEIVPISIAQKKGDPIVFDTGGLHGPSVARPRRAVRRGFLHRRGVVHQAWRAAVADHSVQHRRDGGLWRAAGAAGVAGDRAVSGDGDAGFWHHHSNFDQ
jgi:acetyl-CoA C-acetyltransferase